MFTIMSSTQELEAAVDVAKAKYRQAFDAGDLDAQSKYAEEFADLHFKITLKEAFAKKAALTGAVRVVEASNA